MIGHLHKKPVLRMYFHSAATFAHPGIDRKSRIIRKFVPLVFLALVACNRTQKNSDSAIAGSVEVIPSSQKSESVHNNGGTTAHKSIETHPQWENVASFCKKETAKCAIGEKGIIVNFADGEVIEYTEDGMISHYSPEQLLKVKLYDDLIEALNRKEPSQVKKCLDSGADPKDTFLYSDVKGIMIGNPINIVIGETEIVKLLLEAGADPDYCCCACETAIHAAILDGQIETATLLLEYGASTEKRYKSKWSALQLAEKIGSTEMIELIKSNH